MTFRYTLLSVILASLLTLAMHASASQFKVTEVASGLKHPWDIIFLDNDNAIVSQRAGGVSLMTLSGQLTPIQGLPSALFTRQGGTMGLAIDPEFDSNGFIYVCMTREQAGKNSSQVLRFRLNDDSAHSVTEIFTASPLVDNGFHYGCRLMFDQEHQLFVTLGDRYKYMKDAQSIDNHHGKIVRITRDGEPSDGNPFREGLAPEVFSFGHRNVQGISVHPNTGAIWAVEHGPKGGDEINRIERGKNYGWPAVSYGIDYDGSIITDKTQAPGMQQPLLYWNPSIAPGDMEFYTGSLFPQLTGKLLLGALKYRELRIIDVDAQGKIGAQQVVLKELGHRIRAVRQAPDGSIILLTDSNNGKVLRLTPN